MALEAGSLFARLSAVSDESGKKGFQQFDDALGKSRRASERPVEGKLGAKVDATGFSKFDMAMRKVAQEKATGIVSVDDGPARVKIDGLKAVVKETKREIESGKKFQLDTGVARAELRLLQAEIRKTEREAARARLGFAGGGGAGGGVARLASGGAADGGGLPAVGGLPLALGAGAVIGGPLVGSAGAGLIGAGVLGAGGLGAAVAGLGALAAVAKPAQAQVKLVSTAYEHLQLVIAEHGAKSKQAATAQKHLNAVIQQAGPVAAKAGKASADFADAWIHGTQHAQGAIANLEGSIYTFLTRQIPLIDKLASRSANSIRTGFLAPIEKMFGGHEFHGILDSLSREFARLTGPLGHAAADLLLSFGRVAQAAEPYVTRLANGFARFAEHLADLTGNKHKLDGFVKGVVSQFESWLHLTGALGRLLFDVFAMGRKQGQGMVDGLATVPRLALSVGEACEVLGVSHDFWQEHVAAEVRIVRRGRRKLVPVRELERWLEANAETTLE